MIRKAKIEDVDKLIELAKVWYSESGDEFNNIGLGFDFDVLEKSYLGFIGSKDFIFLIADEGGDILGNIGAIVFLSPINGKKILQEIFWYVHPHYRKYGLRLLKALAKKGKEIGCELMMFGTSRNIQEEKLMRVYKKLGFKQAETNFIKEL